MPVDGVLDAFLAAIAQVDYDDIPGSPDDPVSDMSWMRQYCSEYGFYQRGDPSNPVSIETSFLSLELFQAQWRGRAQWKWQAVVADDGSLSPRERRRRASLTKLRLLSRLRYSLLALLYSLLQWLCVYYDCLSDFSPDFSRT